MNKKLKIFYIVDVVVMIVSIIGMLAIDSKQTYGLSALTSIGYFTVLLCIFGISVMLFMVVSFVYIVAKNRKRRSTTKQ